MLRDDGVVVDDSAVLLQVLLLITFVFDKVCCFVLLTYTCAANIDVSGVHICHYLLSRQL